MHHQFLTLVFCFGCSLFLGGCGGGLNDAPETGDVSGTVTMDDKPLANANVSFQAERSRPAYGVTDANGKYTLTYSKELTGAKIGENIVTITSGGATEGEYSEEENKKDPLIPAKYNAEAAKNPEMKVEVKAGSNQFDFKLKSNE